MRRALLSWTLVFALLLAGFAATVTALNADTFSAGGFVRGYLEALQRGDSAAALAMPGVGEARGDLLGEQPLEGIHLLSDVNGTVRFEYSLGGEVLVSEFHVKRDGTRLGLFALWSFAVSPVATLEVGVDHDTALTVNGVTVAPGPQEVLVPGSYTLDQETALVTAVDVPVLVSEVGGVVAAELAVTATDEFDGAATAAVAAYLDACATQQVLMPTGCPFGETVANRVDSAPQWSIVDYPELQVVPGNAPGEWTAAAEATAHLTVRVKSLFDGSVSTLDEHVEFWHDYSVVIGPDGVLSVRSA